MAAIERPTTESAAISNAMVKLHKEQFGRGPTRARTHFAGPDALVCVLEDVLLPAELKLIDKGEEARVRDGRTAFQVATRDEFVAAVEQIVYRKVRSFASAVDPGTNTVFEVFVFESRHDGNSGSGSDVPA
jgi:uncharacterized protein YbcI